MRKIFILLVLIMLTGCHTDLEEELTTPEISTKIHNETIEIETTATTTIATTVTSVTTTTPEPQKVYDYELVTHFLNVGQGDSIFIELGNNKCMLVDAGESTAGDYITEYIKKLGYDKIDVLVATHPHADHIGGMAYILESFKIGEMYISYAYNGTKTYEKLLDLISQKHINISVPLSGDTIYKYDDIEITVLAPMSEADGNINNASIILGVSFVETGLLLMADAEIEEEESIKNIKKYDLIKIGHHGSSTSTSEGFLKKIAPKYAVISCGKDNSYGHPSDVTLKLLTENKVNISRTDLEGTIIFKSDGYTLEKVS